MRWIAGFFGLIIVVIVGAFFALPYVVTPEAIKEQLQNQAEKHTGRSLSIEGDIAYTFWPSLGVTIEGVKFGNAAWSKSPHMLVADKIAVGVALLPLLDQKVEIESLVLTKPVMHLEQRADGSSNWQFAFAKPRTEVAGPAYAATGMGALEDLSFDHVEIIDGTVHYKKATDAPISLSALNVTLSLPAASAPLAVDGSTDWQEKTVRYNAEVASLSGVLSHAVTGLTVQVQSPDMRGAYKGTITAGQTQVALAGMVNSEISDLPALQAWLTGKAQDASAKMPKQIQLQGKLDYVPEQLSLKEMVLNIDQNTGTGSVIARLGGKRPHIQSDMTFEALDIRAYMPEKTAALDASPWDMIRSAYASAGWDATPIDFSGLRSVNANQTLRIGTLTLRDDIVVNNIVVNSLLNDGQLQSSTSEALSAFGGTIKARIGVDARGETPALQINLDGNDVQVEPMLIALAGKDTMTGTGNLTTALTTRGSSQAEWMMNLAGTGSMLVKDGMVRGFDLAGLARNLKANLNKDRSTDQRATDFGALSASYVITDGLLQNSDLKLQSPFMRATGAGTVNIPDQTLQYRVEATLTGSDKGQDADFEKGGITIPVKIAGAWEAPSIEADIKGTLERNAQKEINKSIEKVLQHPDGVSDGLKELQKGLKGLLGGGE